LSTAPESEHLPDRPHWRCRVCARPWPCPDARASLLHEYRAYPSLLKIYLAAQMYEALDDFTAHGEVPPLDLYDRFLIWARAHPTAASRPPDADDPTPSLPVPPPLAAPPPVTPPATTPQIRPPLIAALSPTPLPY
jgi:hypothetical protein